MQLRALVAKEQGQHPKDFGRGVLGVETAAWAWTEPGLGYIHFRIFSCLLLFSQRPALPLCISPSFHDRNDKCGGCAGGWDWESLAGRRQRRGCCPRPPTQGIQGSSVAGCGPSEIPGVP